MILNTTGNNANGSFAETSSRLNLNNATFIAMEIWSGFILIARSLKMRMEGTPPLLDLRPRYTDHKRIEHEHEQLAEQLARAQKMEAVGRLAGGVAHEFNNRLMTILGNTELLLSRLDSPTWQDHREQLKLCVQSIARAGERSTALTKQLLSFSRKPLTQPEPVDTHQLLRETQAMLQPLIGENITFDVHVASDVAAIYGNAGQIEQVITNLVLNARDSISDIGCVAVTCKNVEVPASLASVQSQAQQGPHVQITVQDDGAGMSEAVRAHIFEPFFSTKPVGKGTGLGLATVHGIVSQMGGFVTVESQERVGTTFHVTLPVAENACHQVDTLDPQVHLGNGEVILVCEDEQLSSYAHSAKSNQCRIRRSRSRKRRPGARRSPHVGQAHRCTCYRYCHAGHEWV